MVMSALLRFSFRRIPRSPQLISENMKVLPLAQPKRNSTSLGERSAGMVKVKFCSCQMQLAHSCSSACWRPVCSRSEAGYSAINSASVLVRMV